MKVMVVIESWNLTFINKFIFLFIMKNKFFSLVPLNVVIKLSYKSVSGLNRFFIGVNEYDSYEMLTFASWKTKVC